MYSHTLNTCTYFVLNHRDSQNIVTLNGDEVAQAIHSGSQCCVIIVMIFTPSSPLQFLPFLSPLEEFVISPKGMEWNWRRLCFHFCVCVCLCTLSPMGRMTYCIRLLCEKSRIFPYGQYIVGNIVLLAFWWYRQVQDRSGGWGEMYKNVISCPSDVLASLLTAANYYVRRGYNIIGGITYFQ